MLETHEPGVPFEVFMEVRCKYVFEALTQDTSKGDRPVICRVAAGAFYEDQVNSLLLLIIRYASLI